MYVKKYKYHFIFGIAASTAAYCVTIMPHTVFLKKIEETVSLYRRGLRVPINNTMKKLCQEVMDDLKFPKNIQSRIRPFHVFGFEMFHAGSLVSKSGAIVGIPINFTYVDTTVVPSTEIIINHKVINPFAKEAEDLINSLILSEDAKKYAIAHEILRIRSGEIYTNAYGLCSIILIATVVYNRIVHKYNLYERRPLYRYVLLSVSSVIGLVSWFAFKDIINRRLDITVDESISKLGLNYTKGGKEFYENLIKRNIALRSLMGKDGEKLFSVNGNVEYMLRQKSMPLSHRKNFFESKLQNVTYVA